MIEISYLNGVPLGDSLTDRIASAFAHNAKDLLFKAGYPRTPYDHLGSRSVVLGFLLYTNAHVEFLKFIKDETSWAFLNSITGKYFYVFSTKLYGPQSVLSEEQESVMTDLFEVFKLTPVAPPYPHLILCDFRVSHEDRRGDHYYKGDLTEFAAFQLGDNENTDYLNILRRALSPVSRSLVGSEKRLTHAVRVIKKAQLGNLMKLATRDLFVSDFSRKFAAAWRLLNWNPVRID